MVYNDSIKGVADELGRSEAFGWDLVSFSFSFVLENLARF